MLYLMKATLNMVNLAKYAAEQRHSDPDRTAHCLMAESFGKTQMPKPFVIKTKLDDGVIHGTVLAYTSLTAADLKKVAWGHQKLAHGAVMDPNTIMTMGVPESWSEGQTLQFDVHVKPTKRSSSRDAEHPNTEQDVYLAAGADTNRGEIYCQWLSELITRQGVLQAAPESMTMTQFTMRRVKRQGSSQWIKGPDATISGTATVVNPSMVVSMLAGGIGRHKGYGYGMLLLRPGSPVGAGMSLACY